MMRQRERRLMFCFAIWGVIVCFLCVIVPEVATAEISGYADLLYVHQKSTDETPDGQVTNSKGDVFLQRYSLTLTRNLYPNLGLLLNGVFEQNSSNTNTNGIDSEVTNRIVRPLAELTLKTPPYYADLFYNRRAATIDVSVAPSVTNITEIYKAGFGWNSALYPTGKLDIARTNLFDENRTFRDLSTDYYSLKLYYYPVRRLSLRSRTEYQVSTNKIDGVDSNIFTEDAVIGYDTSFLNNRVSLGVNYEINLTKINASQSGSGELLLQVFPLAGLSLLDNSPSNGALDNNPALIDGDKQTGAGINLGLPPPGGNTDLRNLGLDFFQEQEVDTLRIWIDREIPSEIANSFGWDLYTSSDNLTWTYVRSIRPAVFDTARNFFDIQFPAVTARYVKVVVPPLSPAVPQAPQFPAIFVTEMEAFHRQAPEGGGQDFSLTTTTHNLNTTAKVILLDRPLIFFDTSYALLATQSKDSTTRWSLTNGLNIVHAFNEVFSAVARVSREDDSDPINGKSEIYRSSVSVTAIPVRKLSNNLTASWSREKNPEGTITSKQLYLDNTASLYRGLDVYLNGGLGTATDEKGMKRNSTIVNGGVQVVPHPTLTLDLNYLYNESKPSDGGPAERKVFSRTLEGDVTFIPVPSLSFAFSLTRSMQESRSETLRNLSVNWAPFPGGALVLSFNYYEELRTSDNNLLTTIRPFVRWNITNKMWLEVSYYNTKSEGDIENSTSDFLTTHFYVRF